MGKHRIRYSGHYFRGVFPCGWAELALLNAFLRNSFVVCNYIFSALIILCYKRVFVFKSPILVYALQRGVEQSPPLFGDAAEKPVRGLCYSVVSLC